MHVFSVNGTVRIREEKAPHYRAKWIGTGESLAQVASQTLDNLYVWMMRYHCRLYVPSLDLIRKRP